MHKPRAHMLVVMWRTEVNQTCLCPLSLFMLQSAQAGSGVTGLLNQTIGVSGSVLSLAGRGFPGSSTLSST